MYDIIIIGAGPAGLSAAIYGQRAGKKTLVLDAKGFGGQILNTPEVENYPGVGKVSGFDLASNFYEQAVRQNAEILCEKAVSIETEGEQKIVRTETGTYEAKAVILATGAKNRPLGIPTEEKFVGVGLSYCATCDGAFFRGKDVAVIGGGNTALEEGEVLSGLCNRVYLVHRRDTVKGEAVIVKRLQEKEHVEFVLDSVAEEILGENQVSGLKIRNVKTGETRVLDVQGIFVAIGQMPDNEHFVNVVTLDRSGYIQAGEDCLTETPGVFAAGDCRVKKIRQLTTAAADGAAAALAASDYINSL